MSEERLPTELLVSAQIRIAAQSGVPIFVLHKGDLNSGVVTVKVNLMDRTALIYSQVRDDETLVWQAPLGPDPIPEAEADSYMARQLSFDPDIWTVEVEDRLGRLWFPGKILSEPD